MSPLAQAVKAAEKDYSRLQDWERQELFDEINRLTDAGVSASTIAVLVGMSERHVVRIRNGQVKQPRQAAVYEFDTSEIRSKHLDKVADAAVDVACRLRDEDPQLIYDALARMERHDLIELVMVALAAMPIDKPKSQIFAWLEEW